MLYYLSLIVFLLLSIQLSVQMWHLLKRSKLQTSQLVAERKLIEQQVDEIIKKSTQFKHQTKAWSGWRKFKIIKIVQENDTVKSFYLQPHDGKILPGFLPGQHLTFKLKVPGQSKPIVRCYTLSDSADENNYYRVSIRKQLAPEAVEGAPDGVSSCYFHDELSTSDVLDVKAPTGKFFLDLSDKSPVVLIAGGIGLTPSLAMLNTLYAQPSARSVHLFYAVRNEADLIMQKHFSKLQKVMPALRIHFFFADIDEQKLSSFRHHGFVTVDRIFGLMGGVTEPSDADFYVCGPPPMMDSVVNGLADLGIHSERIHFESFGPASVSKMPSQTENSVGQEATVAVEFHISNKSIDWNSQQGTLLEAAELAGINMESGCRAGSCGTCLTAILQGGVEYIEEPGTDIETGSCLPCICVPKKGLKLNA